MDHWSRHFGGGWGRDGNKRSIMRVDISGRSGRLSRCKKHGYSMGTMPIPTSWRRQLLSPRCFSTAVLQLAHIQFQLQFAASESIGSSFDYSATLDSTSSTSSLCYLASKICRSVTMVCQYDYTIPSSSLSAQTQHFRYWILSPRSGDACSVGPKTFKVLIPVPKAETTLFTGAICLPSFTISSATSSYASPFSKLLKLCMNEMQYSNRSE